ncbi:MAG: hypothetical protein Q8K79_18650 [Solirubrobacteraceae bacterium]|nr:hypothetical protein [Solirubrobacteraceae bacterium]
MADDPHVCVRCNQPVVVNREMYEVFERMHWVCFHFEFEHGEHDPDVGCADPSCPMGATRINYLRDLGFEIRSQAEAATKYARNNLEDGFAQGVARGYYVVLSLMLDQANAFAIPPDSLRLEGLDPERDLL